MDMGVLLNAIVNYLKKNLLCTNIHINFVPQSTFKIFKMNTQQQHLDNLAEIRSLMERSSRFISLSGLSGVFAGLFALIGAALAYYYLNSEPVYRPYYEYAFGPDGSINRNFFIFIFADAGAVLFASLLAGILLTINKAKKKGIPYWDPAARLMLINLLIPLVSGGIFCLVLLYHHMMGLVAPVTLIFYGLALFNAGKYTLNDIRYLGVSEIVLGLVSSFYIGYGLLFWALGFGILHIVYGLVMYNKYER